MKSMTKQWIEKAESDQIVAQKFLAANVRQHDSICFHCQQSAEKYLKALLEESNQVVPRIHDLDFLLTLLKAAFPELQPLRRGLLILSEHAVDAMYPGVHSTKRDAERALKKSSEVRAACRAILKVKVKPVRKK